MRTLLIAASMISIGLVAFAGNPVTPPRSASPDVLVLILGITPPFDMISINYATVVPETQARADLQTLVSQTGWRTEDVQVTTRSGGAPGAKPTTAILFRTNSIADNVNGTLPLSPFVNAFKRFKLIVVNYGGLAASFRFEGLRDYDDRYVGVKFDEYGNSYRYRVTIKDPGFDRIQLPVKPVPQVKSEPKAPVPLGARIMLVLGVSIIGAAGAYLLTMYLSNRRRAD